MVEVAAVASGKDAAQVLVVADRDVAQALDRAEAQVVDRDVVPGEAEAA